MDKCINFQGFLRYLLDDEGLAEKGSRIVKGLLEAQSPRLTNISEKMSGNSSSRYKEILRFLKAVNLTKALKRLYQEDAEFVIGDATEMERYKAPKTNYVGTLRWKNSRILVAGAFDTLSWALASLFETNSGAVDLILKNTKDTTRFPLPGESGQSLLSHGILSTSSRLG